MAKLYGQNVNQIIPQSDFTVSQNENLGWVGQQTFRIRKGDIDSPAIYSKFPAGALLGSLDPNCDTTFAYLRLSKILSVRTVEGGWTEISGEFVGFALSSSANDTPLPAPQPTYYKRGTLRAMTLDKHPKWKALDNIQKTILGYLLSGIYIWDIENSKVKILQEDGSLVLDTTLTAMVTGDAADFATLIAQGETTYDLGTYEYSHRWEDNVGISASQMNDLGKISTPSGSPPKPGTGRNWLMVGANEEQHGAGEFRFTNELTYLLSDDGGHDSFLYT
jgi:hypothetical protein